MIEDLDLPTQLLAERMLLFVTKQMAQNLVEEFVQADGPASVSAIELYTSRACDLFLGPTDPTKLRIPAPVGANYALAFESAKTRMVETYLDLVDVAKHPHRWNA